MLFPLPHTALDQRVLGLNGQLQHTGHAQLPEEHEQLLHLRALVRQRPRVMDETVQLARMLLHDSHGQGMQSGRSSNIGLDLAKDALAVCPALLGDIYVVMGAAEDLVRELVIESQFDLQGMDRRRVTMWKCKKCNTGAGIVEASTLMTCALLHSAGSKPHRPCRATQRHTDPGTRNADLILESKGRRYATHHMYGNLTTYDRQ